MNSNIFETQYKQLQAQGYYLLFNMFCSGKYAQTLCKHKKPRLIFFIFYSKLTTRRSTIEIRTRLFWIMLQLFQQFSNDFVATLRKENQAPPRVAEAV